MIFGNGPSTPRQLEIGLHATEVDGRISKSGARSTAIVDLVVVESELIGANKSYAVCAGIVHEVVADDRRLAPQAVGHDAVVPDPIEMVSRQRHAFACSRGWRRRRRRTIRWAEKAGDDAMRLNIWLAGSSVADGTRVHVDWRVECVDPVLAGVQDRGGGNRQLGRNTNDWSAVDGDTCLRVIDEAVNQHAGALLACLVGDRDPAPVSSLWLTAVRAGYQNRRTGNGCPSRARGVLHTGEDLLAAGSTRHQAATVQSNGTAEGFDNVSGAHG